VVTTDADGIRSARLASPRASASADAQRASPAPSFPVSSGGQKPPRFATRIALAPDRTGPVATSVPPRHSHSSGRTIHRRVAGRRFAARVPDRAVDCCCHGKKATRNRIASDDLCCRVRLSASSSSSSSSSPAAAYLGVVLGAYHITRDMAVSRVRT
jgi:hypothetical protein